MHQRRLPFRGLFAFFALGLILLGCSDSHQSVKPSIAISMATFQIQRLPREASTITRLANEKGMVVITRDANKDVELQKKQLDDFIAQKIPVIIVVAVDGEALAGQVEKARNQGLHIIAYDRLIPSPGLTAYISFDNIEVGRQQARALLEKAPSGNYVLLGGSPTDNNAHLVRKGQLEILAPHMLRKAVRIIEAPFIPNWEPHLAFIEMERILKEHDNRVDAVVASNDGLALGAIQALKIKGLAKSIPVSGQDATTEGCKAIAEGDLTVSVFKNIHRLAPLAFEITEKILQNQPLHLDKLALRDLSADVGRDGFVPCKLLEVTTIDKSNLYERIILTHFHKWDDVFKDLPQDQRPPRPDNYGTEQKTKSE